MKIDGHEVVVCGDCAFPDGEPIMHVMAPLGPPCEEVMSTMRKQLESREESADQRIAAQLREDYWGTLGHDRGPWKGASVESQRAWLRVVKRARELLK